MQLPKAEEQLMEHLWNLEKAFMKDLLESYPEPKPANTTLATLLKRLSDKQAVSYRLYGNSREYYPLIDRSTYFAGQVQRLVKSFNNSSAQFASFFTRETNLTEEELKALRDIIDAEIDKKKTR